MASHNLFLLVVSFYAASSLTSVLTKALLNRFPRPVTVSLARSSYQIELTRSVPAEQFVTGLRDHWDGWGRNAACSSQDTGSSGDGEWRICVEHELHESAWV